MVHNHITLDTMIKKKGKEVNSDATVFLYHIPFSFFHYLVVRPFSNQGSDTNSLKCENLD